MNGALLVDKPAGITSHDVVAIVRRALSEEGRSSRPAVGHTGTLDPFATGLLVVLVGKATRLARFLDRFEKTYRAVVRLGQGSSTDDSTGDLTPRTSHLAPRTGDVEQALAGFVGTLLQMPPAFSAKKIDGERAYTRARKGEEVVLKPVEVTIHAAELIRYEWPDVEIRVRVSTGTYIRSLARDLGAKLGMPAHCAALRRESIGRFTVQGAQALEALTDARSDGRTVARLIPMAEVVTHLIQREVNPDEVKRLMHGGAFEERGGEVGPVALMRKGELLGIGEVKDGKIRPMVVLMDGA